MTTRLVSKIIIPNNNKGTRLVLPLLSNLFNCNNNNNNNNNVSVLLIQELLSCINKNCQEEEDQQHKERNVISILLINRECELIFMLLICLSIHIKSRTKEEEEIIISVTLIDEESVLLITFSKLSIHNCTVGNKDCFLHDTSIIHQNKLY